MFIDEPILRKILSCTVTEGQTHKAGWSITIEMLEAYLALEYARGIYGKGHSTDFLWSKIYGPTIFKDTMSRFAYKEIRKFLRFDIKSTRSSRIQKDRFTHIRDIFDRFAMNSRKVYTPSFSLTIDEQLLPIKGLCPFVVYMPNKPDKFDIKFWMLAEVDSKYVVNIIPYLGSQEKQSRDGPLAESVVMKITEPVQSKGYNVTTDNFFTSFELAKKLQKEGTSIVETVRANSKRLPKEVTGPVKGGKYGSKFYYEEQCKCMFVNYQCKDKKSVCLLSTMHASPSVSGGEKKKPDVVQFYNQNKVAVDVVDQMVRMYSTRCATRRWPVGLWCNVLDLAAQNSWIIYKKSTGKKISQKQFILELVEELRSQHTQAQNPTHAPLPIVFESNQELFTNK